MYVYHKHKASRVSDFCAQVDTGYLQQRREKLLERVAAWDVFLAQQQEVLDTHPCQAKLVTLLQDQERVQEEGRDARDKLRLDSQQSEGLQEELVLRRDALRLLLAQIAALETRREALQLRIEGLQDRYARATTAFSIALEENMEQTRKNVVALQQQYRDTEKEFHRQMHPVAKKLREGHKQREKLQRRLYEVERDLVRFTAPEQVPEQASEQADEPQVAHAS